MRLAKSDPLLGSRGSAQARVRGAPDAWLEVRPSVEHGLDGLKVGDDVIVVTWLHKARRDVLKVHPRSDKQLPTYGRLRDQISRPPEPVGVSSRDCAANCRE